MLLVLDEAIIGALVTRPFAGIVGKAGHVLLLAHPHATPRQVQVLVTRAKWSAWGWAAVGIPAFAVMSGALSFCGLGLAIALTAAAGLSVLAVWAITVLLQRSESVEALTVSPESWAYAYIVSAIRGSTRASWDDLWNATEESHSE